eukprot:gene6313-6548_t
MQPELLQEAVDYQVVHARLRDETVSKADAHKRIQHQHVLEELQQQLPLLIDSSPLQVLQQPHFWDFAQAAAATTPPLAQDLPILGYDLDSALLLASQQLQQLQELLGLQVSDLQKDLQQLVKVDGSAFSSGTAASQLATAVAGNKEGKESLAQLQLMQVLAQALGLSSVQLTGPLSACELVLRLTGVSWQQRQQLVAPEGVEQSLSAIAPQLVAAVSQLPVSALKQPSVENLLQLMQSQEALKDAAAALTSWRAEAASAGHLPVLMTLTAAEVQGLSRQQSEAVGRQVMQLEAQGRLLLRKAAAGQLLLGQLGASDAAALAWKVHVGGQAAAEQLVQLVLAQAGECFAAAVSEVESAESALARLSAGFRLEEATSRLDTAAPPSPLVMAGIPQHQVAELSKVLPGGGRPSDGTHYAHGSTAEQLVRDLALLMSHPQKAAAASSSPLLISPLLQATIQRLHIIAHDLPQVLSGPLLDLVSSFQPETAGESSAARQQHQRLRTLMQVLAAELPRLAAAEMSGRSGSSSWAEALTAGAAGEEELQGLLELVGEQEAQEVLVHAAAAGGGRAGARGEEEGQDGEEQGLYEMLADVHHDQDMQRYLQASQKRLKMEFDASLDLDLVHAPRGWQDPELFQQPADWLEGMRPLLNQHLTAQGEQPVNDSEWQVYKGAALAEHEQVELAAAACHRAAGHSPFHNSRADEAYLMQRLEAGIPKESVLHDAAHRYLTASFRNRTWRFAQRKHLVDRLIEIAAHLAAHPPRTHRGSPFSALFQQDGPPLVPRLAHTQQQLRGQAGPKTGDDDDEVFALPASFTASSSPSASAAGAIAAGR